MKMFNGLANVEIMSSTPLPNEVLQKVVESVNSEDLDLGDFEEQLNTIAQKIEESIATEEVPLLTTNEESFLFGLAMVLGIQF